MKLPRNEFIKLQQEWYQKLAEAGFKDIERLRGDDLVLVPSGTELRYRRTNAHYRRLKEEYYRCIAQEAQDEENVFRNEVDKYILIRHSEGAKIKTIVKELEESGNGRNRDSVRFIIRRYEMEWGLGNYDHKQLHIKKKA